MGKRRSPVAFFTLGIAGLFLAGFFLLVVFGALTYRNAVETQDQNNSIRALLSYLPTCVKANDTAGAVTCYQEEGGPVLVVADQETGYAIRVYQREGLLLEDYGKLQAPLDPVGAAVIGKTRVFQVEQEGSRFTVVTDAGQTVFTARSEK